MMKLLRKISCIFLLFPVLGYGADLRNAAAAANVLDPIQPDSSPSLKNLCLVTLAATMANQTPAQVAQTGDKLCPTPAQTALLSNPQVAITRRISQPIGRDIAPQPKPNPLMNEQILGAPALRDEFLEYHVKNPFMLKEFKTILARREFKRIDVHQGDLICALQWTSDSKHLVAVMSEGVIKVWDTTWQETNFQGPRGGEEWRPRIAMCPNSATTFLLAGTTIRPEQYDIKGVAAGVVAVPIGIYGVLFSYSPENGNLALVTNSTITLVNDVFQTLVIFNTDYPIKALAWRSDGQYLAAGGDQGVVTIWKHDSELLTRAKIEHVELSRIAQTHDLTGQQQQRRETVQEVITQNGWRVAKTLRCEHARVLALAWSPDGQYLAIGGNFGLKLWDIREARNFEAQRWKLETQEHGEVVALAWNPDGRCLTSGAERGLGLWKQEDGQLNGPWKLEKKLYDDCVFSLAWSPNGKFLAAGTLGGLRRWATQAGQDEDQQELSAEPVKDEFKPQSERYRDYHGATNRYPNLLYYLGLGTLFHLVSWGSYKYKVLRPGQGELLAASIVVMIEFIRFMHTVFRDDDEDDDE